MLTSEAEERADLCACLNIAACLLSAGPNQMEQELLHLANSSPVDLLCAPVPSCLPSPQLRPDPVILQPTDLIQFEEHPQEPLGRLHPNAEHLSVCLTNDP